ARRRKGATASVQRTSRPRPRPEQSARRELESIGAKLRRVAHPPSLRAAVTTTLGRGHMKYRLTALLAVAVAALAITGSALAFDCIRVSSSLQGLQHSTANSGHWLLFDMTNTTLVQSDLSLFTDVPLTPTQAACVSSAYQETGLTPYFALGFGVAG